MASDQLISVPLKTTVEVAFNEPLSKYFTKELGVKDKVKVDAICFEFTRLRNLATTNTTVDKSLTSRLQLISRYADQIYALIVKLPPSEKINWQFTWDDALDKVTLFNAKKGSSTSPLLTFEHICLLFNIASLQSQLGAEQRLADTDEELKTAAKYFQNAAGIFDHISSHIEAAVPNLNLTPDLNIDVLSALSYLMLAQAQEMIVKKAIRDKMKEGILAKLCAQTEEMYTETFLKMTKETAKNLWEKSWISNIAAKQLLYSGLSQFFQSSVACAGKRMGEQIGRLNFCIELLKKSQDKQKLSTSVQYLTEANRLATDAKKENDFIYHEIIPDSKSLAAIEKAASARLAKLTPIPEQFSTDFKDVLADIEIEQKEKGEAPLKAALDASIHAAGYYMNKLFSGKKGK